MYTTVSTGDKLKRLYSKSKKRSFIFWSKYKKTHYPLSEFICKNQNEIIRQTVIKNDDILIRLTLSRGNRVIDDKKKFRMVRSPRTRDMHNRYYSIIITDSIWRWAQSNKSYRFSP